jgi:hypothetical protein
LMAARPGPILGTKLPPRPTQYRSFHVSHQPANAPLQSWMARPFMRGDRQGDATPLIFIVYRREI